MSTAREQHEELLLSIKNAKPGDHILIGERWFVKSKGGSLLLMDPQPVGIRDYERSKKKGGKRS